jgi:SAM-dependent methyltransferase
MAQRAAWSSPPVDGVGYLPSAEMLRMPDEQLVQVILTMRNERYSDWRNFQNRWRDLMGLDSLVAKDVIDWGCGVGLEALELASAGNRVTVADIVPSNVDLAARVGELFGHAFHVRVLEQRSPFLPDSPGRYDVFYCNGVLHHIREPQLVMQRAYEILRPGGQARLMVYSDRGWTTATGTEPPQDVAGHPKFMQFVRFFDDVGYWADWYNRERLEQRFGQWFTVERFAYLTPDSRYCAAVLRRK